MEIIVVKCNLCGLEIDTGRHHYSHVDHLFGFGTDLDSINVKFDLCESCLIDLFATFKIRPCVCDLSPTSLEDDFQLNEVIDNLERG